MQKIQASILFIFLTFSLFGQKLSGFVFDEENKALQGVLVFVENNGSSVFTNAKGFFELETKGGEDYMTARFDLATLELFPLTLILISLGYFKVNSIKHRHSEQF